MGVEAIRVHLPRPGGHHQPLAYEAVIAVCALRAGITLICATSRCGSQYLSKNSKLTDCVTWTLRTLSSKLPDVSRDDSVSRIPLIKEGLKTLQYDFTR